MTTEIPLSKGMVALVDDEDVDLIRSRGPWHVRDNKRGATFYAAHSVSDRPKLLMHSLITGLSYVDHVNRNGLDNRRCNLRAATHAQNMANKPPLARSGLKGVKALPSGRWGATFDRQYLGSFDTPAEAAIAYDIAARARFGEFAYLNFPKVAA